MNLSDVQSVYSKYMKPVWVTEFGQVGATSAQMLPFLQSVLPWLDGQNYVQRYAYFWDAPGEPYMITSDGKSLSTIGRYYNNNNS